MMGVLQCLICLVIFGQILAQTDDPIPVTLTSAASGDDALDTRDPTSLAPRQHTDDPWTTDIPWTDAGGVNTSWPEEVNVTALEGEALMKYLFSIGFHSDVYLEECEQKLIDHGYFPKLSVVHVFCMCLLSCFYPFVDHQLSEADQARLVELSKVVSVRSDAIKFQWLLPMTAGVTTSYGVISLVGIVGNLLVLITVARFMHKPSVTYIFICSIACSDLLVCSICAPMKMYKRLNSRTTDIHLCRSMNFLYYLSLGCSIFSLLAMSLERYLVICHPMKAHSVSTSSRAKKIVGAVWAGSCVVAIPFTYFTLSGSSCIIGIPANHHRLFMFGLGGILYIVPVALMSFAYASVSVELWRSIKVSKSMQHGETNGKEPDKKATEKRNEASSRVAVIKMLVLVLVIFIMCWSPYWYFNMIRFTSYISTTNFYYLGVIESVTNILAYLNSCINPILYAFSSKPMRNGFIDCFLVCCGKPPRSLKDGSTTKSMTGSTAISSISKPSVTA